MCGIWAIFGCDNNKADILKNVFRIAHRGTKCFRVCNLPQLSNCVLGFHQSRTTLAQNDGMQPMALKQFPHLTLLCDGIIYNYKQLQKAFSFSYESNSECEVILHLYNTLGAEKTCQLLDGVFAFAIIDVIKKQVVLSRDTFGVRPLFQVRTNSGVFAICSEAKGLCELENGKKIQSPQHFLPGHYMVCDVMEDRKLKPSLPVQFHQIGEMPVHFQYHNIDLEQHGESGDLGIYRNIRTLFTNAVEKRLMGFQSVCTMLSGGLDSSLVSAIAANKLQEIGKGPLQTFIIDIAESPDLKAARKVAEHIGSEHHEIVCTEEEIVAAVEASIFALESYDTITLRDALQTLVLCKYAQGKTENSLMLCGDGADDVLQGYSFFQHHSSPEGRDVESRRLLRDIYLYDVLRIDHCTAVHGFETRVPYLDHVFTSYCLSLPPTLRAHKEIEKHVIRKSFEGTGLIPDEILWRRKEKLDDCVTSTDPWSRILLHVADKLITDKNLSDASIAYPHNTPQTKLELYYRQIFEKHFGSKMSKLCPYQWKQKWVDVNKRKE